ncbi:MAG: UDP-N-acetylmuramate dehydrogenase [Candidatus Eisenbacteria bacterium]|nr:UDP-N-acetylmuramate dehydrogenase [Candidatus Eisenbacteria bacterium]
MSPPGARWSESVPLAPLTTWRIGGPARALAEPSTPEEPAEARRAADLRGWPVWILGGGSNVLVADQGFPGLVIRYADRRRAIETRGEEALVQVGSRAPLAGLARATARAGLRGLQWAEGIPGTVGGAIVGNAGAYGGEIAEALAEVTIVTPDGRIEQRDAAWLAYGYRTSRLKSLDPSSLVVSARFRLTRDDPAALAAEVSRIGAERRARTPVGASCGSVFRNPPGTSAGRLIDLAGCKGLRRGGAVVSELHANYILNTGGATARDVRELIEEIRARVGAAFGITLELEIRTIGFS